MKSREHRRLVRDLLESVRRLAAPAERQVAFLMELETHGAADELALEFDDLLQAVPLLVKAGVVSVESVPALRELDRELESLPDDRWAPDLLATRPEWARVRAVAARALRQLEADALRATA